MMMEASAALTSSSVLLGRLLISVSFMPCLRPAVAASEPSGTCLSSMPDAHGAGLIARMANRTAMISIQMRKGSLAIANLLGVVLLLVVDEQGRIHKIGHQDVCKESDEEDGEHFFEGWGGGGCQGA